jgi:type III secretory pathway component EscV
LPFYHIIQIAFSFSYDLNAKKLFGNVEVRRFVRRLLETDFPALPVLAFGELLPSVNVAAGGACRALSAARSLHIPP